MSESELYFILAEAQAILGQDATAAFEKAVSSNVKEYFAIAGEEIEDADVEDYIEGLADLFAADPLKEIRIQKYLAQTRGEVIETYNDMRRIIYTDGKYPVEMKNPNNTSLTPTLQLPSVLAMRQVCISSLRTCGGQVVTANPYHSI